LDGSIRNAELDLVMHFGFSDLKLNSGFWIEQSEM